MNEDREEERGRESAQERERRLEEMLARTPREVLELFLTEAASRSPELYAELIEYISDAPSSFPLIGIDDGKALDMWERAESSISDLYEYGGWDYDEEEAVCDLLRELAETLEKGYTSEDRRREIMEYAFEYLKQDDYGVHDFLYDVVLSACANDDDLDYLRRALEAQGDDLDVFDVSSMAAFYKRSGDREKYLAIRLENLKWARDYLDLAEFHRDCGDWEEAMKVAEAGLEKTDGYKNDLRSFVIERLEATGERDRATELRFEQFACTTFFEEYLKFRRACSDEEWDAYRERVAERMEKANPEDRIFYHIHCGEGHDAVLIFLRHAKNFHWSDTIFAAAEKLEADYPERMHDCYVASMTNLYKTTGRVEYALNARKMAAVRRVLVERLGDDAKWKAFAGKVKRGNSRRPALQDEFARVIPGWKALK